MVEETVAAAVVRAKHTRSMPHARWDGRVCEEPRDNHDHRRVAPLDSCAGIRRAQPYTRHATLVAPLERHLDNAVSKRMKRLKRLQRSKFRAQCGESGTSVSVRHVFHVA